MIIENQGKPNDTASLLSFYKLSLETSRVLRFSQVSYQASYQVSYMFPYIYRRKVSMDASPGNLLFYVVY